MRGSAGETPESGTMGLTAPDSRTEAGFSELDLALVEALQTAPRASWSRIGQALGVDPTTAARRWERLRSAGLAWITAYSTARTATVAYVEVRCRPRRLEEISAAAAALPWVISIDETAGAHDLLLTVVAADPPALGRAVRHGIGGLRGVRSTRTLLGITQYGEGSDWRTRAMRPAERAALGGGPPPGRMAYSAHMHDLPGPADQALLTALGTDGRLGYGELGAAAGVSEHTARRRLQRMIRDGEVVLRCDLARPLAGLPTALVYHANAPLAQLERIGAALSRSEQVRLCVSVSGPHNLLIVVWLHGLGGVAPFETLLAGRFPELEIRDRTVILHSAKRMGWLLDQDGRATGRVPFALPTPGDGA